MPLVDYTRTNRLVFDIDLDADPYDRWQEVGRQNKFRLGRFLRDIETMCNQCINEIVDAHSSSIPDFIKPFSKSLMARFRKGDANHINIAPLGCVGVLSGMRVGAWAVTLNQAPATGRPQFFQWPAVHRLRKASDSSMTFPSLVRKLTEYQKMTSFFAHAIGMKPEEQAVVKSTSDTFLKKKAKSGKPLIQTNHFVHTAYRHHNGEEWQGHDCDICDRYAALDKRLRKKPKDFADAFSRIHGRPMTHSETMNQVTLRPADGKAIVRVHT